MIPPRSRRTRWRVDSWRTRQTRHSPTTHEDSSLQRVASVGSEGGLSYLLNVVVAQRPAIFELFTGEDESLLIRRYSFLVLDL